MRTHIRPLVAGILMVLGACSSTLDARQLESEIATQLADRLQGAGWSVTCPDGVKPAKGGTFECSATSADGETFSIEVTQEDADGSVTWRILQ